MSRAIFNDFKRLHPNTQEQYMPTQQNIARWRYHINATKQRQQLAEQVKSHYQPKLTAQYTAQQGGFYFSRVPNTSRDELRKSFDMEDANTCLNILRNCGAYTATCSFCDHEAKTMEFLDMAYRTELL